MTRIPETKTVVSYAYTVKVNGKAVGTLQTFTPSGTRMLDRVREIMNEENDIVEIVPGRTEFTATIDRLETYDEALIQALGYDNFTTLDQITTPIQIIEEISGPNGKRRTIHYEDCWIQSVNKTIREGTITVSESVTLWVTRVQVLS
jgi:hypothetical protein